MDENNGGLDRLCEIYRKLGDGDKEEIIRLAEELLHTQKINTEKPLKESFRTNFINLDNSKIGVK